MSWDQYVSDQLVGTGHVSKAAICGTDGSIWAKSPDWNVTPEELKSIATVLPSPENFSMTGIVLASQKYFFLSSTEDSVRGKSGADGIHITKTKQAFIIGMYVNPIVPGQCANAVESLADYLRNAGY